MRTGCRLVVAAEQLVLSSLSCGSNGEALSATGGSPALGARRTINRGQRIPAADPCARIRRPIDQSAFLAALDLPCFVGCCSLGPGICLVGAAFFDGPALACCTRAFASRLAKMAASRALSWSSRMALAATRNTPRSRANMKKHIPKIPMKVSHSHHVVGRGCPSGIGEVRSN
jgi:hypothetical protein